MTLTRPGAGGPAGANPATPLDKAAGSDTILLPASGGWTMHVGGQGTNVIVQVDLIERYTGSLQSNRRSSTPLSLSPPAMSSAP